MTPHNAEPGTEPDASGRRPWWRAFRPVRAGRRALVLDVLLWLVLTFNVTVAAISNQLSGFGGLTLVNAAISVVLLGIAVAISRTYPLASLLIAGMLALLDTPTMSSGAFLLAVVVTSYQVGRRMEEARPALIAYAAILLVASINSIVIRPDVAAWFSMLLALLFAGVFPWLVGRYWRQYQQLIAAGWERAQQLEREQRIIADQERLRERSRIAQDMHDSLGHELSLIALRAGALEVAPDLDERYRTAAKDLRSAAATATDRLHEIIGVLREDSGQAPMEPAHESVVELVERARASGVRIRLRTEGAIVELAPMVDRAAHRVVQEAVTNATKHAPGADVTVRLAYSPDELVVGVTNTAPSGGPPPDRVRGRRGLIGLSERVRLVGGTLHTGPLDGGFEVTARLPRTPKGAAAEATAESPADTTLDTESGRHLAAARRRVRRGLVMAIGIPVVVALALALAQGLYYSYSTNNSVLHPSDYEVFIVGEERSDLVGLLPDRQLADPPTSYEPALPANADCEYYRSAGSLFSSAYTVYRLCFRRGLLVSADDYPSA